MKSDEFNDFSEWLSYDPDTGYIKWKKYRSGVKLDREAGCVKMNITSGVYYRVIRFKDRTYKAHRLAWLLHYGQWPKFQIDHIDGDGLNNSISNLRSVTPSDNCKNRSLRSDNTSGVPGVVFSKNEAKWKADIKSLGKRTHLGTFSDKFEAICARKSAELLYGFHENHGRIKSVLEDEQ